MTTDDQKYHHALITMRYVQKMTFLEIASKLGISVAKARNNYNLVARELREANALWSYGLSVRAFNCLIGSMGFKSKRQVLDAIKSGHLRPNKLPRNYGKKTHAEVLRWLGLNKDR